jgi:dihydrofolate reductase
MRKLIVSTYATLDNRVDDLPEWSIPYNDESSAAYHADLLENSDGLLLGRRTYEIFAALWPSRGTEHPYIDKMNRMAKYVVSAGLQDPRWNNSHVVAGDVVEGVAALKRQPGRDLVLYGGPGLISGLLGHDLIDEYRVLVHPVLLGRGRTLSGERLNLDLVTTARLAGGVVVLTYRPAR